MAGIRADQVRPERGGIHVLYDNYLSDHAGEESDEALRLVLVRDLLPWIPRASARCLDIGCGQGGLVEFLRQRGFTAAYGVDLSREQVEFAHSRGRDFVRRGDVIDFLSEQPREWDVITAFDFLEHLPRDSVLPVLKAVQQSLSRGGLLIARVPNGAGPLSGAIQHSDFTHESTFTARSLSQLGHAAGFASAEFREVPPVVHGVASGLRRAVWSGYAAATRLALGAETGHLRGHLVTGNIMGYLTK